MQGPHSVKEIKSLLNDRKIHSLFKVQVNGSEVLVREFLANLNQEEKRSVKEQADRETKTQLTKAPETAPEPAVIDNSYKRAPEPLVGSETGQLNPSPDPAESAGQPWVEPKYSYGVTSFVLSLLFLLPVLNLFAWVISLVFGHMFLAAAKGDRTHRGYYLAWSGVWLTYIFGAFYTATGAVGAVIVADNPYFQLDDWLVVIHVLMIIGAISSCVTSGLLIAGTKMMAGSAPKTGVAFVAGTFGVVAGLTLGFFSALIAPEAAEMSRTGILIKIAIGFVVLLIQALVWSEMIRVKNDEKLGFGRAIVVSIFCVVCQLFLGFAFLVLKTMVD